MGLSAHIVRVWTCYADGDRYIAGPKESIRDLKAWHRITCHANGAANGRDQVFVVYAHESERGEKHA